MGGYVNLAVRQGGEVRHRLSYTGALVHLQDVALYDGDRAAIDRLLSHYDDCPEVDDPDARGVVPFNYGIVVLDVDGRQLFDLQSHRDLWGAMPSLPQVIEEPDYQLAAYRLGWLGEGPVDLITGEQLARFDDQHAGDPHSWMTWHRELANTRNETRRQAKGGRLGFGESVLPGVRLAPPNWARLSVSDLESPTLLQALLDAGFSLNDRDKAIWQAWHEDRLRWRAENEAASAAHLASRKE